MQVANATAAVYAKCPPFATYHVHAKIIVGRGSNELDKTVTVRTADQVAVVHDDEKNADVLEPPFPTPPNFDELSHFTFSGTFTVQLGKQGARDVDFRIDNLNPLTYKDTVSHADAVSRSVKGYAIAYAPDSTGDVAHLIMTPSNELRKTSGYLTDVYYSVATHLPTRVILYRRKNAMTLDVRYQMVGDAWLVQSVLFGYTVDLGPFTKRVGIEATYDGYTFSESAPDPRLVPVPSPAPTSLPSSM